MKVVFLLWYSSKKIGSKKMKLPLASNFEFKTWKGPIFDVSQSSFLKDTNKASMNIHLGMKFNWISPASLTVMALSIILLSINDHKTF